MTPELSLEALNARIERLHGRIDKLDAKLAEIPETPGTEEEKRERHRLSSLRHYLEDKLPLLLFASGRASEVDPGKHCIGGAFTASFSVGEEDLECLPFAPVLVDRGKDGDLFLCYLESPAKNGWIKIALQTRYADTWAFCYKTLEEAQEGGPFLYTLDFEDWPERKRHGPIRLETPVPPDPERATAAFAWYARKAIPDLLLSHGKVHDGWIRWDMEAKRLVESYSYWEA